MSRETMLWKPLLIPVVYDPLPDKDFLDSELGDIYPLNPSNIRQSIFQSRLYSNQDQVNLASERAL